MDADEGAALRLWDRAAGRQDGGGQDGGDSAEILTTPRQRQLLNDLTGGCSKAQAAKRAGMAERTAAKEPGVLRDRLGLSALCQLMAAWRATSPDRALA